MSQSQQVKFATPNGDWCALDNSAAQTTTNLNAGAPIGFDTTVPGSLSQGLNLFGDTGSTTLDSVNDTVYADPSITTVVGNPTAATAPTFKTVTTVLNVASGQRLLWKNPALIPDFDILEQIIL